MSIVHSNFFPKKIQKPKKLTFFAFIFIIKESRITFFKNKTYILEQEYLFGNLPISGFLLLPSHIDPSIAFLVVAHYDSFVQLFYHNLFWHMSRNVLEHQLRQNILEFSPVPTFAPKLSVYLLGSWYIKYLENKLFDLKNLLESRKQYSRFVFF